MKKMLMTLAAAFFAVALVADTEDANGYTWTFTIVGDGARIYKGFSAAISPAPSGGVTIPATLGGKPVTAIGACAFLNCTGLTDIWLPDTVTSIEGRAFEGCTGLGGIAIPASVADIAPYAFDSCSGLMWVLVDANNADYKSVNGMLLTKDGTTLVQGINGGVTIPDGVTTIGDSAFYGCSELWSVAIPSSVTTIEGYAFGDCDNHLESVVIPSSVTAIGDSAFSGCDSLKHVTLPQAGVDNFGGLFGGYSDLKVVIADGVTSIPDNAFKGCTGIKSVLIPGSVTTIGESAFQGCEGLECLSICSGVTTIKANAFKTCKSLDYVTIPESVYEIGTKAFANCINLEHAFLPYGNFNSKDTEVNDIFDGSPANYGKSVKFVADVSVVAVGDVGLIYYRDSGSMRVGGGAGGLAVPKSATGELIIPSMLDGNPTRRILSLAFKGCAGLTKVTVPSSVTSIASDAFDDCTGLWYAVIPASFEGSIPSSLGSVSSVCTRDVTVTLAGDGILWAYAVDGAGNAILGDGYGAPAVPSATAGALTIPSLINGHPVTAIGSSAFYNCSGLTSVTIPSGVTEIGDYAFQGCKGLMSVAIPSGVTDIGMYAFEGCEALKNIVLPQSVTLCADYAFQNCSHLESAVMPEGLESDASYRENRVFESTPLVGSVDYLDVDVAVVDGRAWVYTVDGSGNATVGGGKLDSGNYLLAITPATAVGSVAIPATLGVYPVAAIGDAAFCDCDGLTGVDIPSSVAAIGDEAFYDCDGLTSVTIGNGVATVGDSAFEECSALTSVTILEGVTSVGDGAFAYCSGLATMAIPSTVEDIHPYAFDYCTGLTAFSVADGNTVYSSANGLLLSKDGKTLVKGVNGDVTIPVGVEIIGDSAFYGYGLTSVLIPSSVTNIEDYAFSECAMLASVAIPFGVTSIGEYAFSYCGLLADISIPSSVTSIGTDAFDSTPSLTTVHVEAGDTDRVKDLIRDSGRGVASITFVEDVPPTYTVTFDANGGSVSPATRLVTANMTVGELPVPTREEYTFKGWFTAVEGGDQVAAATVVTADVTYYAQWKKNAFTATFNANGGSVSPATRLVANGAAVGELPTATRDGYTLKGWFTAAEGGEEVTAATVVTADVTYYAQWAEVSAYTWYTTRAEALAEAKRTGKTVFMICGRDTCGNTMYTKNVACEDPKVKGKLTAKCVLWYTNCDTQLDENRYYWPTGSFTLPLVCIIDPNDPENYLLRVTGPQTADGILNLLQSIPEPSGSPVIDPDSLDPFNPGSLSCYEVLNPRDIWDPIRAPKALVLNGALYYGCDVVGIVELKVGKPSKDMYAKVSGTVILLDGKKYSIKSQKCYFGGNLATTLNLDVKGGGRLSIAIGSIGGVNVFSGELGKWHVQTANVGGNWSKYTATAKMDMSDVLDSLPSGILSGLLPTNEVAKVSGGKWKFAKAASVKYAKPKAGQSTLTPIDAAGKGLVVDTSKGKTNLSGIKLTYTSKNGTFKGSFKMFELKGGKLTKNTINVNGVVVDGVGYGTATGKKLGVSCPVVVE